jgi:hypothetical protein
MEITVDPRVEEALNASSAGLSEYRENIRRIMHDEVNRALDEEVRKASQELLEEQRKAIRQILEEHKSAIRQVVDEEKKTIRQKAAMLRQSILKFGL